MKILFYLDKLSIEDLTSKLALELASYLHKNFPIYIEFAVNEKSDDIFIRDFYINRISGSNIFDKSQSLKYLLEIKDFDVVFSYFLNQNLTLALTKMFLDKKDVVFIGSIHRADNFERYGSFYKLPVRYITGALLNKLDGLVVDSYTIKDDVEDTFFVSPDKIRVIYNFIDIKEIRKFALERIEDEYKNIFKYPVVINVASLTKEKGHEYLIKAFKEVKSNVPRAKLVIIGEGEEKENLQRLIKELDLEKDIFLLGFKENPYKYMISSEIFALPSLREGYSRAVLEAQALGLPVVAFKSKGSHLEFLGNSAVFVKEKDIKGLAKALIKLLTNDEEREIYRKKSIENIKNFTIEKQAKAYLNYFEDLKKQKELELIISGKE
jgi:glycosyltransferase involved in cell wall biosynthesis